MTVQIRTYEELGRLYTVRTSGVIYCGSYAFTLQMEHLLPKNRCIFVYRDRDTLCWKQPKGKFGISEEMIEKIVVE